MENPKYELTSSGIRERLVKGLERALIPDAEVKSDLPPTLRRVVEETQAIKRALIQSRRTEESEYPNLWQDACWAADCWNDNFVGRQTNPLDNCQSPEYSNPFVAWGDWGDWSSDWVTDYADHPQPWHPNYDSIKWCSDWADWSADYIDYP